MSTETELQSFLIKLRYQIDEASFNKADSKTSELLKSAFKWTAIISAFKVAQKHVFEYTESLSDFYLKSKNLGNSSIEAFKSLGKAAADVGSSIDEMTSALEGLQKFKRTMGPGAINYIRQFAPDITSKDSATDMMNKLINNMPSLKKRGMTEPNFIKAMEMAGVDYNTAWQLYENPEKLRERTEVHKKALGDAEDKLAPKANEAMLSMSEAKSAGTNFWASTGGSAEVTAMKWEADHLAELAESAKEYVPEIDKAMDKIAGMFEQMKGAFDSESSYLKRIAEGIERISHPVDTALNALGVGGATAGALGTAAILNPRAVVGGTGIPLSKFANPLSRPSLAVELSAYAGFEGTRRLNALLGNPAGTWGSMYYDYSHDVNGNATKPVSKALDWYNEEAPSWFSQKHNAGEASDRKKAIAAGLLAAGISKSTVAGVIGNLQEESSKFSPFALGDGGKAYGIMQWHPDRQANYEKVFGHTMKSVTNEKEALAEQTAFIAWERQNTEKRGWDKTEAMRDDPYARGAGFSQLVVRPAAREAAAAERGANAQDAYNSLPNVTININGGDIPAIKRTVGEVLQGNEQLRSRNVQQLYQ